MNEYIEREALYEKAYWHGEHPDVGNPFPDGVDAIDIKDVDAIPAADVAPVRHGRWEKQSGLYSCSECGMTCPYDVQADVIEYWACNYCPNCGAIMDLED